MRSTTRRRCGRWLAAGLLVWGVGAPVGGHAQQAPSTLVVLVRHAERAAVEGDDPPISEAGQARARALAAALANANVTHVITSSRRRTTETAQPLLDARRLTPEAIAVESVTETHVANVAAAVRRQHGGLVLVVGHSNTVPAIVHALGGPALPNLCDNVFGTMFVMELPGSVPSAPRVIRTHYGAPDPPNAEICSTATAAPAAAVPGGPRP